MCLTFYSFEVLTVILHTSAVMLHVSNVPLQHKHRNPNMLEEQQMITPINADLKVF